MTSDLPPLTPVRRRRWLTWLLVAAVFVSGLVIGGAGATIFIIRRVQYAVHHPDEFPARATARLTRRLQLDAEQSAKVRALLDERVEHLREIRRRFAPEFRSELDGFHADVRRVLNPTQQAEWDRLFSDLETNWLPAPLETPTTTAAPLTTPATKP